MDVPSHLEHTSPSIPNKLNHSLICITVINNVLLHTTIDETKMSDYLEYHPFLSSKQSFTEKFIENPHLRLDEHTLTNVSSFKLNSDKQTSEI